MKFVIAKRRLAMPGGSETFALTLAESLAQLGHGVLLYAPELGMAAEEAQRRALDVCSDPRKLPEAANACISLDRDIAIELAMIYPRAVRVFAMQSVLEHSLPPPQPGIVAATLVMNERFASLARGCSGAGEVIRINQPIDMVRFSPRGFARSVPQKVLLVGNYASAEGQRIAALQAAWCDANLTWEQLGFPEPDFHVTERMADADIVAGYGRAVLEAMSCARPAYVHEHSGSDGWVTPDNYARLEASGFSGCALRAHPTAAQLRDDLAHYNPELGRAGQDLIRMHHDAKIIAAKVVEHVNALNPGPAPDDSVALHVIKRLADSHHRAEARAEYLRGEAKATRAELETVKRQLKVLRNELEMSRAATAALLGSTSWRLTTPIRILAHKLKRRPPKQDGSE